jgi:hypothetical protein
VKQRLAHIYYRLAEAGRRKILERLVPTSTLIAQRRLRTAAPVKVLLDNSVRAHGVTHKSAWIDTGKKKWGDVDIDTGYLARVPVYSFKNDTRTYKEIQYLAGIAHLTKRESIQLFDSVELQSERLRQPWGRFTGYGYYDLAIFEGIKIKSVDRALSIELDNPKERQLARVKACRDPLFHSLLKILGDENSLDAYHIYTAERFGLFCFLHMDFKLERLLTQKRAMQVVAGLKTKILTPAQFGKHVGLVPLHPWVWTYDGADFPSRHELHLKA